MFPKILLITPPFTQLNTPYPATPYLKGFLEHQGYVVFQADLSIELINRTFSRDGFQNIFDLVKKKPDQLSSNAQRIIRNERYYLQTIEGVMNFLKHRDNTLAQALSEDHFLPRASRFDQLPDLEWSFGNIGVNDKARFFATLYIEDIGDLIKEAVTPYFGFTRYAEKLGMSAHFFAPIDAALRGPDTLLDAWLLELLQKHLEHHRPDVVGITIPFPGNLFAALKCGQFIKNSFAHMNVIAGGGFVTTELRELSAPAVFDYLDYITLDDGERPFVNILEYLEGEKDQSNLTRTFIRIGSEVHYMDNRQQDFSHAEVGSPDYSDLPLDQYLSLIEIANPMHRLWSDGQWNKLMIAHGCYWHQCSFCDTSLDYIKRFDSAPASVLVDRIEKVIAQTGQRGFHFVDEAAPPALLKELALELLRREIGISWWGNIRFEHAFTRDLCRLLAASGCIAVTGGLETASDRLLKLMHKGVTIRQAARVCRNFAAAGIMVHTYLMYGFPTQTEQETVDSLDIVRQFFKNGLVQSAFWHRFTVTVHSDVGRNPEKYKSAIIAAPEGRFARNDLMHEDPVGCDHELFAQGLNKAVYNFMHGIGMDFPVREWFEFKVPLVSKKRKKYVAQAINDREVPDKDRLQSRVLWLEIRPQWERHDHSGKGKSAGKGSLVFYTKTESFVLIVNTEIGEWLNKMFDQFSVHGQGLMTLKELKKNYEKRFSSPFETFLRSKEWKNLRERGLLLV
jgi:hypothetical protein